MSISASEEGNWVKIDLHIHTLDDPKDAVHYSAHQLLERARSLGFSVLAITLHDAVFDRKEVFADAAAMGILLIPAAEMRLCGADVIVLNVTSEEVAQLKNFDDLRRLRAQRGSSIFTIAPHPFYVLVGSIQLAAQKVWHPSLANHSLPLPPRTGCIPLGSITPASRCRVRLPAKTF